jgi:3-oxoacyl-[acyl-carrier protein] reductase
MDLGLDGRVYVLSGASKGLGYATAQALTADGARVVISARDADRIATAVEKLNQAAGAERAHGLAANLAAPNTPARLIHAAQDTFGRLDGALISVGGPPRATAAEATDDQWREAFETIFLGSVRLARTMLKALEPGGAIGFVLSSSVRSPLDGLGVSNGLRPGLAGVVKDMSDEYGPKGVRVFSLLPNRIMTDRNTELVSASPDPKAALAEMASAIPLRRIGEPAEFGKVAAFLLSPAASYLTGLSVPVDGGAIRSL